MVMDLEQFCKIAQSIRPQLLRTAKQMLNHSGEAEDIVQEILLRLWLLRSTLDKYEDIESVAIKAVKNKCIDRHRQKKTEYEDITNHLEEYRGLNPHQQMESKEQLHALLDIIQQLPDIQRLIIQLKDVEGYETDEIVKITQSSADAVRMNLSRARKKVRELFTKRYKE
jgi:RNA polymerase sigma-70 factor (ECF subfamily)